MAVSGASTLPAAMANFWQAAYELAMEDGPVGRQRVVAFPNWSDSADVKFFQYLLDHISDCAEVCEYLGESLLVGGRHPLQPQTADEPQPAPCPMILLRSFSQREWGDFSQENYGEADPFAAMDIEEDGLFESAREGGAVSGKEAVEETRAWVGSLVEKIGVPEAAAGGASFGGGLRYVLEPAATGEQVYRAFWSAAGALVASEPSELEASLVLSPRFAQFNAGGFEAFAATLNTALSSLNAGRDFQFIFFHPDFEVSAEDRAVGFVDDRISPYPTAALLRTAQVQQHRAGAAAGSREARTLVDFHERLVRVD